MISPNENKASTIDGDTNPEAVTKFLFAEGVAKKEG